MNNSATTGDAINHAVDKITDAVAQVAHAVSSAAPHAWKLIVEGGIAQAESNLIYGAAMVLVSIILGAIGVTGVRWATKQERVGREGNDMTDGVGVYFIGCCILSIVAVGTLFLATSYLFDPNSIAMLISPEGTTASNLLQRAL